MSTAPSRSVARPGLTLALLAFAQFMTAIVPRGLDGRAAVGPMLREYLFGETMYALGIPTTRALAVVATGERIERDGRELPGAVLTRVAASHLRVGTFQYAAAAAPAALRALADHAIARHFPDAAHAGRPFRELFRRVVDAQAAPSPTSSGPAWWTSPVRERART